MRITVKENNRDRILQVVCNCCRRPLPVENGIVLEDYIHVDKAWGYFSERDGEKIAHDLKNSVPIIFFYCYSHCFPP